MVSLRTLNLYATILHYVLALGLAIYFGYLNNKYTNQPVQGVELTLRDHELSLISYVGNCPATSDPSGNTVYCDSSNNNGIGSGWKSTVTATPSIQLIQKLIIGFFLITGSFHLTYYLTSNDEKDNYSVMIANGNNYLRWIEYCITSTMMLYIIAFSSGVKDTNVYIMLFANNVAMISQGQLVEEAVRDGKPWWIPMVTSFMLLFSEFFIIARSFFRQLNSVNSFLDKNKTGPLASITKGATIPTWIKLVIMILFVFYSCFGFVSLIGSIAKVKYESIEKAYIILSFVAKATLGIFVAFGIAQRQQGWKKP